MFRHDASGAFIHERPSDRYYISDDGTPGGVDIGNINSGTRRDVVTTVDNPSPAADGVAIFLGNGDGTLAATSSPGIGSGSSPVAVLLVDLNDDGQNDIVTVNKGSSNITVLINETAGS